LTDALSDDKTYARKNGAWVEVAASLTKATGAEVTEGTDDAKYLTPKSVTDSNIVQSSDSTVKNEIALTQAAYDAIPTKVSTTVYLIIG